MFCQTSFKRNLTLIYFSVCNHLGKKCLFFMKLMEQPSFHIFSDNFDFNLALKFSFSPSSTQRSKRSHVEMKCLEKLRTVYGS